MKFLMIIVIVFTRIALKAQDSTAVDSTQSARIVQSGLYVDYGKLLSSIPANTSKMEGGIEFIFGEKWQLVGEYGQWKMSPEETIKNGDYTVEGSYSRMGIGYLPYVDDDSRIGIGLRYAIANFSEDIDYSYAPGSGLQDEVDESFPTRNSTASWYEAVFYSDKKLNRRITLGFTFRLRFINSRDEYDPIDVQKIPGYGRGGDKRTAAVNLFLKIPF